MCAGAIIHARVKRVVIGAADPKTGAAGSVFDILNSERHNHQVEISQGILTEECGALLKEFFQERRNKSS
jgi:tRNA(adenine34) deaminase